MSIDIAPPEVVNKDVMFVKDPIKTEEEDKWIEYIIIYFNSSFQWLNYLLNSDFFNSKPEVFLFFLKGSSTVIFFVCVGYFPNIK
jgi:hypothetical protein